MSEPAEVLAGGITDGNPAPRSFLSQETNADSFITQETDHVQSRMKPRNQTIAGCKFREETYHRCIGLH